MKILKFYYGNDPKQIDEFFPQQFEGPVPNLGLLIVEIDGRKLRYDSIFSLDLPRVLAIQHMAANIMRRIQTELFESDEANAILAVQS